jgi:8-oxo-dGTP pyrophosphatase MutT (NUDIX family)
VTEELVDLVDEHDRVVGVITRAEMRARAAWHRAVYLLVQRADDAVLIAQRSFAKDFAPGAWDIGAGGVVAAGEPYDEAARRELAEELGLTGVPLEPLGVTRFERAEGRDDLRLHGRVYRVRHDGPFSFDDGEVLRTEWVTVDELLRLLGERDFVPDAPVVFLPHLPRSFPLSS